MSTWNYFGINYKHRWMNLSETATVVATPSEAKRVLVMCDLLINVNEERRKVLIARKRSTFRVRAAFRKTEKDTLLFVHHIKAR